MLLSLISSVALILLHSEAEVWNTLFSHNIEQGCYHAISVVTNAGA